MFQNLINTSNKIKHNIRSVPRAHTLNDKVLKTPKDNCYINLIYNNINLKGYFNTLLGQVKRNYSKRDLLYIIKPKKFQLKDSSRSYVSKLESLKAEQDTMGRIKTVLPHAAQAAKAAVATRKVRFSNK